MGLTIKKNEMEKEIINDARPLAGTWKDENNNSIKIYEFGKRMKYNEKDGNLDGGGSGMLQPPFFYSSPIGRIAIYRISNEEILIQELNPNELIPINETIFRKID
jgi:hypothetical protein